MKNTSLPLPKVYRLLESGPDVLVTSASAGRAINIPMSWHLMMVLAAYYTAFQDDFSRP